MNVQEKFQSVRRVLNASLIERSQEIDLALVALLQGESLLLVGPPGVAKSLLLDSIMQFIGGDTFSILLTKHTVPEELFGPVSVKGLLEDNYRRITKGKLPEAQGCFLDEIWKASSAILNTLLKILNEKVYENGNETIRCPLQLCVAASNEWPQSNEGGKELSAMFDRFLFRHEVRPVMSRAGRSRLLWDGINLIPHVTEKLDKAEGDLSHAQYFAARVKWSDEAKSLIETIHQELRKEGIVPGDRRCVKSPKSVQAYAWLEGSETVQPEHLEILASVLWDDPTEQPRKAAQIIQKIANPVGMKVNGLLTEVEEILTNITMTDLASVTGGVKKLQAITKDLKAMNSEKSKRAFEYVQGKVKEVRLASLEV